MAETDVRNVTCMLCGCLCDDLVIRTDNDRVVKTWRACVPAREWYLKQSVEPHHPAARINGIAATLDDGIRAAAEILGTASYPLIYGMGTVNCEAQREAVYLAERLGSAIDSHTSLAHGSTKLAGQLVGKVTCTLGEVRNRADLIVYWGANPLVSHPRHVTRYSVYPRGRYLAKRKKSRSVVVVDIESTRSCKIADQFLQVRPGGDFELLTALRALVRGDRVCWKSLAETGVDIDQVKVLAERIMNARFGVFFFGNGLTRSRGTHLNVAAILALTRDLNVGRRFTAIPLRNLGNEAGADNVLSWLSGFPFSVDYSRRYPRYNPGEFSVADLLERGDNDAALIVGADPATSLSPVAVDHLRRIPVVLLDPEETPTSELAQVQIFTAKTGISVAGTAYRMDKVPVPIRSLLPTTAPADEEVLRRLGDCIVATRHDVTSAATHTGSA